MSNAPTLAKTPSNEKPVASGVIFCWASGACGTQAAHGCDGEWSRVKRRAPIMAVVHMSLRQLTLLSCGGGIRGGGVIKEIDGARDWRETRVQSYFSERENYSYRLYFYRTWSVCYTSENQQAYTITQKVVR